MASRVTLKAVNKALNSAGVGAELFKGDGYYYFIGNAMNHCQEQGVYGVRLLSDLSIEQWVEEALNKKHEVDSYSVYD